MDPNDRNNLWIGAKIIWRTKDGASNWTAAGFPLRDGTVSAFAVAPGNSNRVLAATDTGAIYRCDSALDSDSRTEWGVKAFRSPAPVFDDEGFASGEAYMERRRMEAASRQRADEAADAEVSEAFARLAELAVEALANPLQARELSGRPEEMVLNGVFLVEDVVEDGFRAAVDALDRASSLSYELTGPWPPYNFVKRSVEAAR